MTLDFIGSVRFRFEIPDIAIREYGLDQLTAVLERLAREALDSTLRRKRTEFHHLETGEPLVASVELVSVTRGQ